MQTLPNFHPKGVSEQIDARRHEQMMYSHHHYSSSSTASSLDTTGAVLGEEELFTDLLNDILEDAEESAGSAFHQSSSSW